MAVVVGPNFVWCHLPKTGGLVTKYWLRQLLGKRAREIIGNKRHTGISEARGLQKYDHSLQHWISFRKLEDQCLSSIMHIRRFKTFFYPPGYKGRDWERESRKVPQERIPELLIEWDLADATLDFAIDGVDENSLRFVRQENLKQDLEEMTGLAIEVEKMPGTRVKHNKGYVEGRTAWEFDTREFLGEDVIDALHELNPRWSAIQRRIYS